MPKQVPWYKKISRYARSGIKKRYGSISKPKFASIAKDVANLKHLLNVEKKKTDVTLSTPTPLAQYADTSLTTTGVYVTRITPTIDQGIQNNQRTGNSLKLVSAMINLYFTQQQHATESLRLKWYIICVPEEDMPTSQVENKFMEENPFSGVIDFNSSRDPEHFTQFKIIRSGNAYLKADTSHIARTSSANVKVPLKLNHHLKYASNTTADSTKNQFYLYVTVDRGDIALSTGANIQFNTRYYYTDN